MQLSKQPFRSRFLRLALRGAWFLPLAYVVGFACATAEDPTDPGANAGRDASLTPLPSGDASTNFDSAAWTGSDSGLIPPGDATTFDSATDAPVGACGAIGTACDLEGAFGGGCPFFFSCEEWKDPFIIPLPDAGDAGKPDAKPPAGDAATDAGAADAAGDAAPLDGVCVAIAFGGSGDCNDGINACDAGAKCLLRARRCLTAQEAECICDNPTFAGACD